MILRKQKLRLLSIVIVMLAWLVLGLATPLLMRLNTTDTAFRDVVVAATADHHMLAQPVHLSSIPNISVDRGRLAVADSTGKPLTGLEAGKALASGAARLLLDRATLSIGTDKPFSAIPTFDDEFPPAPLVEVLQSIDFSRISVSGSTVKVALPSGQTAILESVDAEISMVRKSSLSAKGTGRLRGHEVAFEIAVGAKLDAALTAAPRPLTVKFKSTLLSASFQGQLVSKRGIELGGNGTVTMPDLRQAARWIGEAWPHGSGLKAATAAGKVEWSSRMLAFDEANFKLDGNTATGALELSWPNGRPSVAATLALATLDIEPYIGAVSDVKQSLAAALGTFVRSALSAPLAALIDADVRLSAERVKLAELGFGRSAATINLKDGRLLADLAEIDGGRGTAQLRADFTGFAPRIAMRGKFENIELSKVTTVVIKDGAPRTLIQAPCNLFVDVNASGNSAGELLRTLSGKLILKAPGGGRLGLDLHRMQAAAVTKATEGWTDSTLGSTAFDTMSANIVLRDGVLLTEAAELASANAAWTASGLVNLNAGRVDIRLTKAPFKAKAATADLDRTAGVDIQGPWRWPTIRAVRAPEATPASTSSDSTTVPAGKASPAAASTASDKR